MLKYLLLLTSLLFISQPALATNIADSRAVNIFDVPDTPLTYTFFKNKDKEFDVILSGFLTTTMFSNSNWFNNVRTAALNIDIIKDDYAIKMQLSEPFEKTIRRAVIEKSFGIENNKEGIIQVGRFPRLASFYNNVNDAPGSTDLATIPMGEYSRRLIENNTLNSIDGINIVYKQYYPDDFLIVRFGIGDAAIEENCKFQQEITFTACNPNWNYSSTKGGFSIGANYELNRKWEFLAAVNVYKFKTNLLDPNDPVAAYYYSNFAINEGNLGTVGFKYKGKGWYTQTEGTKTIFRVASEGQMANEWTTSSNTYSLISFEINHNLSIYAHYDRAWWATQRVSTDSVVGFTYVYKNTKTSIEYHKGLATTFPTDIGSTGSDWKKQFSPLEKFNSFVLAFTYQF